MIGFLEESPGVKSTSRLVATLGGLAMAAIGFATAVAIIWSAFKPEGRDGMAALITSAGVPLGALGGGVWGALRERTIVNAQEPRASGGNGT